MRGAGRKALKQVPGVLSAEVNLATETAEVTLTSDAAALPRLIAAVEKPTTGQKRSGTTPGTSPAAPSGAPWWQVLQWC